MNKFPRFLALPFALAITAASLLCSPAVAPAQSVAPVPAPTIITSAPYTIIKSGYYQLGADIVYAGNGSTNDAIITIAANNVTLDFGGHYIAGIANNPGTQLYGIYSNEHSQLTIKNGTIALCFVGVFLAGNGQTGSLNINQRVQDMLIGNCYYVGTLFSRATNSQVSTCRVSSIGGTTVSSLTINGTAYTPKGTATGLEFIACTGCTAANNTITNLTGTSGNYGIADFNNSEANVSGNTISTLAATGFGIYATAFATNNTIINSTYGIAFTTKYANNLTSDCTTSFTGGTNLGFNN